MLKAFKLEENSGINAEGFLFQRNHRRATNVSSDPPACILNFSARDHSALRDLVWLLKVATGGLGWSSTIRRKISGRE